MNSAFSAVVERIRKYFFTPCSPLPLAVFRIIFIFGFLISFLFTNDFFLAAITECRGPWLPVSYFRLLSGPLCFSAVGAEILILLWRLALVFSLIGLCTRWSLRCAFLLSLFVVPYYFNFGKLHHISHLPVMILGILSLSRAGDALSIDQLLRGQRGSLNSLSPEYSWTLQLSKYYIVLVYFCAGLQKLRNSGFHWFHAENMQVLLFSRPTLTALGRTVANSPALSLLSAVAIIGVQLSAPLALLRWRLSFLIVGSLALFHIGSYLLMGYYGYFFPYVWCLSAWLPAGTIMSKFQLVEERHKK